MVPVVGKSAVGPYYDGLWWSVHCKSNMSGGVEGVVDLPTFDAVSKSALSPRFLRGQVVDLLSNFVPEFKNDKIPRCHLSRGKYGIRKGC